MRSSSLWLALAVVMATATGAPGTAGARPASSKTRSARKKPAPPPPADADDTATPDPPKPDPDPPTVAVATPPPAEEPARAPEPVVEKPKAPDAASVEALRARYEALKDELFRSRARRETLEGALLSTQLLPSIRWKGGKHHTVTRAEVRLDGTRLWESDGITGDKPLDIGPKSAPPGPHVLGVRVEVRSREDAKLGYVSDQSFTLVLPEGKKTRAQITVDEDGSAPSYNPDLEVEVASK